MLDQVVAAFERQDYPTAAQLLREWVKQSPHDPWVKLYLGRLQEVSGKAKAAEEIYRQLLRTHGNAKLVSQARQGLQRLEAQAQAQRQQAIAEATANPEDQAVGVLIVEAIPSDRRVELAQRFAKLTHTDAYAARGLLPNRGWRLYRAGAIGELTLLSQELRQAGIPSFAAAMAPLKTIPVFQVSYVQTLQPQITVVCKNAAQQQGVLTLAWSEVRQRVDGLLPLFAQVVDRGYRDRLEWKEDIADYSRLADWHLPQRRCILRFHDQHYDFHQGITAQQQHNTRRQGWNDLMHQFDQQQPAHPIWADFTGFAESAADFTDLLDKFPSQVLLPRATDCYFDPAFHLYSCLAFAKVT